MGNLERGCRSEALRLPIEPNGMAAGYGAGKLRKSGLGAKYFCLEIINGSAIVALESFQSFNLRGTPHERAARLHPQGQNPS
ncbi:MULTISPECIES: hypothetical protein [Pseudomonas]|uniref:Uncharacterized protein n=1 Tax=Pseudomonas taiwanensis TaxID=470150 RepID=A0ABR6VBJ3_9PSED|nr:MULTISPECIES: hypothetical protein [Pseudomonas]MBC3477695.1 hypothetical protein [Pseudomonas taiwanensis]MBC3492999.1 hypothetical protein [Pseudomonas taiwanensis]